MMKTGIIFEPCAAARMDCGLRRNDGVSYRRMPVSMVEPCAVAKMDCGLRHNDGVSYRHMPVSMVAPCAVARMDCGLRRNDGGVIPAHAGIHG